MAVTLTEDEAWCLATTAADVLRHRVWLIEARDESSGIRGCMATQYEWINVHILDPKSHAFAALPQNQHGVDYAAYAWATRRALAIWTALARCAGFSARENPAFWLRVLRVVTPPPHGVVSDVPRFFEENGVVFPRFRLTFQPRDCYDEDLHAEDEATNWINAFCDAFFSDDQEVSDDVEELRSYVDRSAPSRVPLQVVFRVPVKRTHSPLGPALEQHRGFLHNAKTLATRIATQQSVRIGKDTCLSIVDTKAMLRGSMLPAEFCDIAPHFQSSHALRVSDLCVDFGEEIALDEFSRALKTTGITNLTLSVTRSTAASIEQLAILLESCSAVRTLRLFNAFGECYVNERRVRWRHLGSALSRSSVQVLVLERACLDAEDAQELQLGFLACASTNRLLSLTIKPVEATDLSVAACIDVLKTFGWSLEHVDLATQCFEATTIDAVLRASPRLRSLRLGATDGIEDSRLIELLQSRECHLSALEVSCSEQDARCIAASLSNQDTEIALSAHYLQELRLWVETLELATRDSVLHMLDTNDSLQYVHLKRRDGTQSLADDRLTAHHQRQFIRKLPLAHILAFLSVLEHKEVASHWRVLQKFDVGISSEIVGFAGHVVRRQFHCS